MADQITGQDGTRTPFYRGVSLSVPFMSWDNVQKCRRVPCPSQSSEVHLLSTTTNRAAGHFLAASMVSSSWPATPLYQPHDPDQQARADEAGNQVADPSPQNDPKEAQNGAGNCRPDDAEHDIHEHALVTLHELLCQPTCNPPDDDGCDPAYSSVSPPASPMKWEHYPNLRNRPPTPSMGRAPSRRAIPRC
jgi:hypothetical protein